MESAIRIEGVSHTFGGKKVLNAIHMEVGKGEIFGLLGPSGAGKTTLINILTGQLSPESGKSFIFETDSLKMTGNDVLKMGIMMDSFGLYERLNCYDNLKFFQMIAGRKMRNIREVLKKVGLTDAEKTPVMNLSKGMKNRLAFARAILGSPALLFLDEPTSGLDPTTLDAIHKMILQEKEQGTTIFLTTHNMQEAEKLCDHIALLNDGNIVEYGSPQDICRRYHHQKRIKIHLKNGEDVRLGYTKEAGEKIASYFESGEIETIHSTEPDLETVFMELTGKVFDK